MRPRQQPAPQERPRPRGAPTAPRARVVALPGAVQAESFYDARGRVYLELADATPSEAGRAMAMLKKLVG